MNEEYRYRISQDEMDYLYKSAKGRMDYNPKSAEKYNNIISKYPYFKTEKEALQAAIKHIKENDTNHQIWAKFEKGDDGIYRIQNYWLLTDDWNIKLAAEYIGMALMYNEARFNRIIGNNVKIDDIIAYWFFLR